MVPWNNNSCHPARCQPAAPYCMQNTSTAKAQHRPATPYPPLCRATRCTSSLRLLPITVVHGPDSQVPTASMQCTQVRQGFRYKKSLYAGP